MKKGLLEEFEASSSYTLFAIRKLVGGSRIIDLLLFKPISYQALSLPENKRLEKILLENKECLLELKIISHHPSLKITRSKPYKILASTLDGEELMLIFFAGNAAMWKIMFKEGQSYAVLGSLKKYGSYFSISHPKIFKDIKTVKEEGGKLQAKYSLIANITQNIVINLIEKYLSSLNHIEDWLPKEDTSFISFENALLFLHKPSSWSEVEKAERRLAFDELLARNLAFLLAGVKTAEVKSPVIDTSRNLIKQALKILPFELTHDQASSLEKILFLQKKDIQESILLQGDVGSGKTAVSLLAALNAVEAGLQVAIMSPTFILAKQTMEVFSVICEKLNIPYIFFSGEDKGKKREGKLVKIKNGEIKIIIGTHALFSADVNFNNLGFVIIDEQHRFGVAQRLELSTKSKGAKTLLMTATPIPRTLSMALYGDLEVCYIKSKPRDRKEIITKVLPTSQIPELIEAIKRKLQTGDLIYWVVPLIEMADEEKGSSRIMISIEERYKSLLDHFDKAVIGVVHGRMRESEISGQMEKFQTGEIKILLATTVIEVGVNVPTATVMIIESAENFGLSTLHQLRGRVGRGSIQSYCFLLYKSKGAHILERLGILASSNDGFFIAEKDMEKRGSGAIFSGMQSGFEDLKFVNFSIHKDLFVKANEYAKSIMNKNKNLENHPNFKTLLTLYNYDKLDFIKS